MPRLTSRLTRHLCEIARAPPPITGKEGNILYQTLTFILTHSKNGYKVGTINKTEPFPAFLVLSSVHTLYILSIES